MPFNVGQTVLFNNQEYKILEKRKGSKTKKVVYQNGICPVGFKSKPPTYRLSENLWVRGSKLTKVATTVENK